MSITPEVLQQVAERLGWESIEDQSGMYGPNIPVHRRWRACEREWHHESHSDGDLLLAILKRTAELGGYIELCGQDDHWTARNSVIRLAHGPCREPLEAAILAFIQLPKVAP
jgi:hypothetical protein